MNEQVFTNAKVVGCTEVFPGTVRVQGGLITMVDRGTAAPGEAEDLEGDYLLPGLVDVHTDNLERHMQPRTNARWPGAAALLAHDAQVAGVGITTVLDAVCLGLEHDQFGRSRDFYRESLWAMREAAASDCLRAEHFLHLRCELPGAEVASQLESFLGEPLLLMVSLMDHTPGQRQTQDTSDARRSEKLRRIVEQERPLSDQEWEERLEAQRARQALHAAENRRKLLAMMSGRETPLASHDDTTVEHVEEAHASGIRICEFPTTLAAAQAARDRGMRTVLGAPNVVLGASQSGNVSARDVAGAGLLDCLSSDYAPVSMLHAAFLLAADDERNLPRTVALVTANPAGIVGLHDRGAIEEGKRADLVQVRCVGGVPRAVRVWREGRRVA